MTEVKLCRGECRVNGSLPDDEETKANSSKTLQSAPGPSGSIHSSQNLEQRPTANDAIPMASQVAGQQTVFTMRRKIPLRRQLLIWLLIYVSVLVLGRYGLDGIWSGVTGYLARAEREN